MAWRWWCRIRWPVAAAFWLAALALGYVGFARNAADLGRTTPPSTLFYLTLQLFVLESGAVSESLNWELEVARLLAPLVAAYTALQALAEDLALPDSVERAARGRERDGSRPGPRAACLPGQSRLSAPSLDVEGHTQPALVRREVIDLCMEVAGW